MLFIAFAAIGFLLLIAALQSGDLFTLLFGGFLLVFGYMFIRSRLGAVDDSRIPKVLVKHDLNELPPFVDATATLSAPSSATSATTRSSPVAWKPLHTTVFEPGAIHRAHKGVLYIDEINLLRLEEQQALLTAMQDRAFPISGRSERSSVH